MKRWSLVPDWKNAWRWWSVQLTLLNGILQAFWEGARAIPEAWEVIPADWRGWITLGLLALALAARMIDQGMNAQDTKP